MKNLKAKLIASVGMLLVAIIMMSTASYAWFTISTSPEISNITSSISANGNLEIALGNQWGTVPSDSDIGDSGKNTAWGNLIDLKNAFVLKSSNGKEYNAIDLKPIRMTVTGSDMKATLSYPEYGKDGRIATMVDLKAVSASSTDVVKDKFNDVSGVTYYVSTCTNLGGNKYSVTYSDIYAYSVNYWLRSNSTPTDAEKIHVFLATASDRATGSDLGETGLGSYIKGDVKESVTIAFRLVASGTDGEWFIASRTNMVGTRSDIVLRKATFTDKDRIIMDDSDTDAAYFGIYPNTASLVTMYVFMNGDGVNNSDAYLNVVDIEMNIQFEIPGLTAAMDVKDNAKNGRS